MLSVSDGRAGNAALANGLGMRLAAELGAAHEAQVWRPWGAWAPPALWPGGAQALKALPTADRPGPPWPLAIVGGGRRVAPLVAAVRAAAQRGGVRLWAIQTPWPQMSADRFDYIITPRHDGRGEAKNVLEILGAPHAPTAQDLATAPPHMAVSGLPRPLIGALIGGSTKRRKFGPEQVDALAARLIDLAHQSGGALAVVPSRRTGADNAARLAAQLATVLGARAWVWDATSDSPNPYRAILAAADALVVTSDSVNMAGEAAATGKPMFVHDIGDPSPKLHQFHADLRAYGAARPIESGWTMWVYPPLDDGGRVAREIAARIRGG